MIDTSKVLFSGYTLADVLTAMKEAGIGVGGSSTATTPVNQPQLTPTTLIPTPMGMQTAAGSGAAGTDMSTWNAQRLEFYYATPASYENDPVKLADFQKIYGPQAVAILKMWHQVPENVNSGYVSNQAERDFFHADGTRAYYSVGELMAMSETAVAASVDVPLSAIKVLYAAGQSSVRFPAK